MTIASAYLFQSQLTIPFFHQLIHANASARFVKNADVRNSVNGLNYDSRRIAAAAILKSRLARPAGNFIFTVKSGEEVRAREGRKRHKHQGGKGRQSCHYKSVGPAAPRRKSEDGNWTSAKREERR